MSSSCRETCIWVHQLDRDWFQEAFDYRWLGPSVAELDGYPVGRFAELMSSVHYLVSLPSCTVQGIWSGLVIQVNPRTGQLLSTVSVPSPQTTSVVFGGENLDELYITSANNHLSQEEQKKYPYAGYTFRVTGVIVKVSTVLLDWISTQHVTEFVVPQLADEVSRGVCFKELTFASESRLAGSAGKVNSTVRVSTAITPTGIPPSRARPTTTSAVASKNDVRVLYLYYPLTQTDKIGTDADGSARHHGDCHHLFVGLGGFTSNHTCCLEIFYT
uniref:SMP-30/Gluconolactonase/LRE-like region domain-containing protein n=1 Tax=Timema monikensis TaxID=170555 RepID=A0A7R9E6U7_9NEOP|nr:unnamed protein product [Timema monikensis]